MKTIGSSEELAPKAFRADNNKVFEFGGRANEMVVNSFKNDKSRYSMCVLNIGAIEEPNFLTLNAKKAFNHLQLAFIKAPILLIIDLKSHIQIKTDLSDYAIGRVSSQLNLNFHASSNQWYLIAYFFRKIIPTKTQYKTHNAELLAIIEVFKTWRHYLESDKYKVLVLINYNNF